MHPDLFESAGTTEEAQALDAAFEAWAAARVNEDPSPGRGLGLREQSADVYRSMWQVFSNWCTRNDCRFRSIDEGSLLAFLDSLGAHGDATLRYQKRMLQLIFKVEQFEARKSSRQANLAISRVKSLARYRYADAESNDTLPEFLTASEAKALIVYVTAQAPTSGALTAPSWKDLRDRTAVAVQLGAGLTPGEVRTMLLPWIRISGGRVKNEPWAISLPGNGNFPARQAPLSSWAGKLLMRWIAVRELQAIGGDLVFPSTRSGKPWTTQSCRDACTDVLSAAGLPSTGGSFKLRHTFALRQLTRHPSAEVAKWLGVQDPATMLRYSRVLQAPVEVI